MWFAAAVDHLRWAYSFPRHALASRLAERAARRDPDQKVKLARPTDIPEAPTSIST
jgi:hypothetical protein